MATPTSTFDLPTRGTLAKFRTAYRALYPETPEAQISAKIKQRREAGLLSQPDDGVDYFRITWATWDMIKADVLGLTYKERTPHNKW